MLRDVIGVKDMLPFPVYILKLSVWSQALGCLCNRVDIICPLLVAIAQKKFLLVATDYINKWVETEAYASIKDKDVFKFV
ncbi:hypothetical protein AAG906_015935 [Vitis piasezkii]